MHGASRSGKGLEEIIPLVSVKFTTLVRIVLPSGIATAIVCRLTTFDFKVLPSSNAPAPETLIDWLLLIDWGALLLLTIIFLLFAILISFGSDKIYRIYEGRFMWPRRLFNSRRNRQQKKVTDLLDRIDQAEKKGDKPELSRLWTRLRMYPEDDQGNPHATHPTVLGNILAGYERYPLTRYGMDSVFFWPRLWLVLDKDKKTEIDKQWAVADGILSLSAVSYLGGMAWILAALLSFGFARLAHSGGPAATRFAVEVGKLPLRLPLSTALDSLAACGERTFRDCRASYDAITKI